MTNAISPVETIIQHALCAFRDGDPTKALAIVNDALGKYKDHADLYHAASRILESMNMHGEGLNMLMQACRTPDVSPNYHLELAERLARIGEFDEAAKCCQTYILAEPQSSLGYTNLARIYKHQNKFAEIEDLLTSAVDTFADPSTKIVVLNELGLHMRAGNFSEKAIDAFNKALDLSEHVSPIQYNIGNVYMDVGNYEEAIRHYHKSIDIDNDNADAHLHLGFAFLAKGNLRRGWSEMEWRWKLPDFSSCALTTPRWRGNKTQGTIILSAEQGLGDSIHFIRYAPKVRALCDRVVVYCPDTLKRLMASNSGVDDVIAWGEPIPEHSCWAPIMSLPLVFKTDINTIPADVPYLSAGPENIQVWSNRLSGLTGPKIGIVWKGNPKNAREKTRSIPSQAVVNMIKSVDASFVCMMKDRPDDIEDWPSNLHHFGEDFSDVSDAAALTENLGLVLSIDTMMTHLAGALNRPLWILLSPVADWRYLLNREDTPWYPSARIFRRSTNEDWDAYMARIGFMLRAHFAPPSSS